MPTVDYRPGLQIFDTVLGEPGALGDLGDRRLVESPLGVELERRLLEATARVGLPPASCSDLTGMTATVIDVTRDDSS